MPDITKPCEVHTTKCLDCNGTAVLKILYLTPPNEPTQVITSITCDICHNQSISTELLQEKHKNGAIKIIARIKTKEDMGRYVSMTKMSTLTIFDKDGSVFYEYRSVDNIHCVVESVLLKAIEEIADYYHLEIKDDLVCEEFIGRVDMVMEKLVENDPEDKIKIQVYETIKKIRLLIEASDFKMQIYDESGYSRIVPIGKRLRDLDIDDLDSFNDELVIHEWVEDK